MPPGRNQRQGNMGFQGPQMGRPRQQGFRGAPFGPSNQNRQPMIQNTNRGGLFGQRRNQSPPAPEPAQGGLLSRILGRNKQGQAPINPFTPPGSIQQAERSGAAVGTAAGLLEGGTLSTVINNTQRVLQAAEQIGPMVQQYGPMVKNIPSMWKLYQAMKSSGDDDTEKETPKEKDVPAKAVVDADVESDKVPIKKTRKKPGSSSPKLYV